MNLSINSNNLKLYTPDRSNRPNVGIGVFMLNKNEDKFLIGKRIKDKVYGLPGGALEHFETFEYSAKREIEEEAGVKIEDESRIKLLGCFNSIKKELNYHWVGVYMIVYLTEDEENSVRNCEEDKCEGWIWMTFEEVINMWESLFHPLQDFISFYKIKSIEDIKKLAKLR